MPEQNTGPSASSRIAPTRFDDLLALHSAICTAQGRPLGANRAARERRDSIPADKVTPPPLVTGLDLIAAGLEPGPRFKEILDELYDAQLNNELTSRDEALQKLSRFISDA